MQDGLVDRVLVKSGFVQVVPLDTGAFLCVHAITQARTVVKRDVLDVLEAFEQPRRVGDYLDGRGPADGVPREAVLHAVSSLLENRMLHAGTREDERARLSAVLSQWYGRDPEEARRADARWRLGRVPRFTAPHARDLASFAPAARRLDVVLVGLCEMQIGIDVFADEARALGIDLHAEATFGNTLDVLDETAYDAILVGPLAERHGSWHEADGRGDLWPPRYEEAVRALVYRIRARSGAPILLQNLPVPTCSPLGHLDRGPDGPVERCRAINAALAALAAGQQDVFVVDVDAALSYEGKRRLLDDRVMSGTHLGGLGWWTQLPDSELGSVHGLKPPVDQLTALGVADPFEFDRVVARARLSLLCALFGIGRRDLVAFVPDGLLWPGELAVTRRPFPLDVDYRLWSYHGFFLAIQEALKGLAARGIRLAAVAASDEATTRAFWRYPEKAPVSRLLLPGDLSAARHGVRDVVEALRSVAAEAETDPGAMVFVATDAALREAAAAAYPGMLVLGGNLFEVRGTLLTHPSLQVVAREREAVEHPAMMVALARREEARKAAADPRAFLEGLRVRCDVRRGMAGGEADRVHELVARTRQFTTTGRVFGRDELQAMAGDPGRRLYTMRVEDRFADYGLVGVAVAIDGTIELLAVSCRVVALGAQDAFLRWIVSDLLGDRPVVRARLLKLAENAPARGLFRENGFTEIEPGLWQHERGRGQDRPGGEPGARP